MRKDVEIKIKRKGKPQALGEGKWCLHLTQSITMNQLCVPGGRHGEEDTGLSRQDVQS